MSRKPSTPPSQAGNRFHQITRIMIREFESDFFRTMDPMRSGAVILENVPNEIRNHPHYRPVDAAIRLARQAHREGEDNRANILLGMAAALHGVIRLDAARELEEALGPALGTTGSAALPRDSAKPSVLVIEVQTFELNDLATILHAEGIKHTFVHQGRVLVAVFVTDAGPISLMVQIVDDADCAHFLFKIPLSVPKRRRSEMALALARANQDLLLGNFGLDLSDGELTYKVVASIDGACLSPGQMRHCMGAGLYSIGKYVPAFHLVVYENMSAEEAIKHVEL